MVDVIKALVHDEKTQQIQLYALNIQNIRNMSGIEFSAYCTTNISVASELKLLKFL